nr:MAG TPA: hypothetical protein [Caudoviricetes sp.]
MNDEKLSLTDFLSAFIDSDNVADSSIDASSNVS